MSWSTYNAAGVLIERGDDSTQTVTDYNPSTGAVVATTPYTVAQIAAAQQNAQLQATLTTIEQQFAALQALVLGKFPPGLSGGPAAAWSNTGTYAPGEAVTYNGIIYINQSGAWLNGFYIPGDPLHPFWSAQPTTAPIPWAVGMPLTPGEYVSNGGHTYQYAVNQPPTVSAPANWAPTGTVSTAAWTFIN